MTVRRMDFTGTQLQRFTGKKRQKMRFEGLLSFSAERWSSVGT